MDDGRRRGGAQWYSFVAWTVPALSLGLCAIAAWLGRRSNSDATHYFFESGDNGHPGIVGIATAMGFYSVAVIAGILALVPAPPRVRHAWSGAAVLFAVLAVDELLQLHAAVPHGDLIARSIYWISLIVIVRALAPYLRGKPGVAMLGAGILLLATSEILDLYPPGDDPAYRLHQLFSVLEESTLSVGTWCLAVACLGFASAILAPAADLSRSEDLEPAQLRRG